METMESTEMKINRDHFIPVGGDTHVRGVGMLILSKLRDGSW